MPRFLGELPTWPEVEEELKKRQADPATIALVRANYWDDCASTEEIKALPSVQREVARSRFFGEPARPFEPSLTPIERAAPFFTSDKLPFAIPPGPPPVAPASAPSAAPLAEPASALGRIRSQPSLMPGVGVAANELARVISERQAGMSPAVSDIVGIIPKILARVGQAATLYPAAAEQLVQKAREALGLGVKPHPPGWQPGIRPTTPESEGGGITFAHEKFVTAKEKMPAKTGAGKVADLVTETAAGMAEVLAPLLVAGGVGRLAVPLAPGIAARLGPMAAEITAARAAGASLAADVAGGGAASAAQALAEGRPVTVSEVGQGAAAMGGIGVGGRWGAKVGAELAQALDHKGLAKAAQILIDTGSKAKATVALKKSLVAGGVAKETLEHAGAAIPIYVSTLEQTKTAAKPDGDPVQAFAQTVALVAAGTISRRVTGPTLMEQGRARLSPEDVVAAARQVREARAARPKGIEPETIEVQAKPVPQPEMRPETHDPTPDITRKGFVPGDDTGIGRPPGERWETDPGAMPGEPYFALDIPKDGGIDDGKAFITERQIEGRGAVWEAWLSDGRGGQFTDVEDAAKWAEEQTDASTIRTRQGQRVPEAAQEGPRAQGGAQEGQGDRGTNLEQAPPREPEPVVEGGKGPVQEVAPIDYRSPAVQKEDAKADRELERKGRAWFVDVDDKPVYTDEKTAIDQGMRGPFSKQTASFMTGASLDDMKIERIAEGAGPVKTIPAFDYTTLPVHKDVRTHPDRQGGWDLVYEQDGKSTGASMSITPAETDGYHVSGIRVPNEMQRQGIATKLFETASRITKGPRREAVSRLSKDAYGFAHHMLVDKGRVELVDADALAADAKRMHEIARQAGLPEEAFWAKVVAGEQGAAAAPPIAPPVGGRGRAPEAEGVVGGLPHATGELGPGAVRPGGGRASGAAAPSPAPSVPQAPAEVAPAPQSYTIESASHAKNAIIVRVQGGTEGMKGPLHGIIEGFKGRYINRERGYILPKSKEAKIREALDAALVAPAAPPTAVPSPKKSLLADKFRRLADNMDATIEDKRRPSTQNVTARRARMEDNRFRDADRLESIQKLLRTFADRVEAGTLPEALRGLNIASRADLETLRDGAVSNRVKYTAFYHKSTLSDLEKATKGLRGVADDRKILGRVQTRISGEDYGADVYGEEEIDAIHRLVSAAKNAGRRTYFQPSEGERLVKMGVRTPDQWQQVKEGVKELLSPKVETQADRVRKLERELIGINFPGFFPTPRAVVDRMIEEADIEPGQTVLEPSAGKGDIADVLREKGVTVETVEAAPRLVAILEAKGYPVVGGDFLEQKDKTYDRIVMNPPFENGQDIEHVQHAYSLLNPGGRVVAIMSEGPFFRTTKKDVAFREWLDSVGGTSEKLSEKSFAGAGAFRQTGTAARLVVIDKPEEPTTAPAEVLPPVEKVGPPPEVPTIPPAEPVYTPPEGTAARVVPARSRVGKDLWALRNADDFVTYGVAGSWDEAKAVADKENLRYAEIAAKDEAASAKFPALTWGKDQPGYVRRLRSGAEVSRFLSAAKEVGWIAQAYEHRIPVYSWGDRLVRLGGGDKPAIHLVTPDEVSTWRKTKEADAYRVKVPTAAPPPPVAPIPAAEAPAPAAPAEVPTIPPAEKPVKRPWEMTQREYVEENRPSNYMMKLGRVPQGLKGMDAIKFVDAQRRNIHRTVVEDALAEGKPVPPEVLADYPDLKPAEGSAPVAPALESEVVTSAIAAYQRKTPTDVSEARTRRDKLEIRQEELNRPLETLKKDYEARRRHTKTRDAAEKRYRTAVAAVDEEARAISTELGTLRKQSYDASLENALLADPQRELNVDDAEMARLGAAMNLLPKSAAGAARRLATEKLRAVADKESEGKSTPEEIEQATEDGVRSLESLPLFSADQHRGAVINSLVTARRNRILDATKDDPDLQAESYGYGGRRWQQDLKAASSMKDLDGVEVSIADARARGAVIRVKQEADRKAADLAEQNRVEKLNRPLPEGVREFSYKLTKAERFVLDNVGLGEDKPAIGGVTLGAGAFHKAADRLRSRGLVAPDSIILTSRGEDVARAVQQERMGLPYDQRPGANWVPPDPLAIAKGYEGIVGKAIGGLFADKKGDPWITNGHFLVRAKPGTKAPEGPAPEIGPMVNITKADLAPISGPVAWYRTERADLAILSTGQIVDANYLAAMLGKEGGDLYCLKGDVGHPLDRVGAIYILRGAKIHGVIMPIRFDGRQGLGLPENYRWMWEDGNVHERDLTKAPKGELAPGTWEPPTETPRPKSPISNKKEWFFRRTNVTQSIDKQQMKRISGYQVEVTGGEGFRFFLFGEKGRWQVIEETSGKSVGGGRSRQDALDDAIATVARAVEKDTLAKVIQENAPPGGMTYLDENGNKIERPTTEAPALEPTEGGGVQESLPFEGIGTEPLLRKVAPKAERIPVAPLPGGTEGETGQLIPTLAKSLARRIRVAKMKRGRLGQYEPSSTATTIRYQGDLATTSHEIGHDLDDAYGITPLFSAGDYDRELAPFWKVGSKIPANRPNALVERRQEGWAEFLRAMIGNPGETWAQAPKLAKLYEEKLPAAVRTILTRYSEGVRRFAGLSPEEMVRTNVEMEAATRTQRLRQELAGTGYEFNTMGWADRLGSRIIDDLGRVMKGIETAKGWRGIDKLLPENDPAILIRNWFGWTEERFVDILANGVPIYSSLRRATGPFADIFGFLDISHADKLQADYRDTVALLLAERVGERAGHIDAEVQAKVDRLDEAVADGRMTEERRDKAVARLNKIAEARKGRLAGWGHGIYSDSEIAAAAVESLKRDPERFARLQKTADAYREWANAVLRYNVDSGRMSEESFEQIKARNQQYAAMHRVASEIDPNYQSGGRPGGRRLGVPTETVQKFTGSTRKLGNPIVNLMMQTAAILREAERNAAVRAFTDILTAPRKMGEGTPIPLEQIGRRVKEGTKDAITVWVNGEPQAWQFEEGLHAELQALGKMPMAPAVLRLPASVLRWSVVHSPPFQIRNAIRDAFERYRVSDVNSLPWDTLMGYTKEQLSDYLRAGGATGWYFHDRTRYALKLQETIEDLAKDETTILASWHSIKRAAERFYRGSELIGRMAEYRRAFTHGKEKLGYDDYSASLFAASKARGLMDFNTAGSWIRWVNQIIPFTNPAVRGVVRNLQAMQQHPGRFMAAWVASILIPKLIEYLWNSMGDDAEEYRQLPDYQRDLFFNLKLAPNLWLRIPLGFEVAVWGGSVTRAIDYARGNKNAFDGHIGQLMRATLPLDESALAGPFRGIIQMALNYDLFRNRHIIPVWEEGKDVRLRDTGRASRLGQAVQQVLGVDARSVDFLLVESLGDLGRYIQEISSVGLTEKRPRTTAERLRQVGAVFATSPAGQAKDVQAIFDTAQRAGMEGDKQVRHLRDLLKQAYESPTDKERDTLLKRMREYATAIRPVIERRADQAIQTKGQR